MAEIKTKPTGADVTAFLDAVPDVTRRRDGHSMRELMERITGEPAVMWGPTMVGFGTMTYTTSTGTNEMFILGFAPRKTDLTLYGLTNAYEEPEPLLDELGPHRLGKSCLYVKRLANIDAAVLERLVRQAWDRRS